jgi:hypothetical protein
MHDNTQQQAKRVYRDVALAALDLLARVESARPPFCTVFTDWLSMMAALGCRFLPSLMRSDSRRQVLMRSQIPFLLQRYQ